MSGKSIRIFLPDGTAAGLRIAELGLSTIKVVVAPRSVLTQLAERPESRKTGLYLLVGDDPEIPGRPKVYVGEADVVLDRIKTHNNDDVKDFFDRVYIFVSKDENLTKAHVRWLEGNLVARLRTANRSTVANATNPDGGNLPEADRDEMAQFLDQSQLLLASLGLAVFEPLAISASSSSTSASAEESEQSFQLQGDGYQATAYLRGGAFVVAKDSLARLTEADSLSDSVKALRAELREARVFVDTASGLNLVQEYEFSSPSRAAQVFCGFSVNGREAWRTVNGTTFADWQESQLEKTEKLD
jgi:hypothetical protein